MVLSSGSSKIVSTQSDSFQKEINWSLGLVETILAIGELYKKKITKNRFQNMHI